MHQRLYFIGFAFSVLIFVQVQGQKRNNIWMFGLNSGIDFNTDPPTPLKKTPVEFITSPYYVSSICDTNGKLLFYTDGAKVWDRLNIQMPKYLSRWPWSGNIMPLICPYPGNDTLYYLFGVSDRSYANRLQYLTINMRGNGGYGNIVYPQLSTLSNYFTVLLNNASVLVAGTEHCNKTDTWIVGHAGDALYSFLVSGKGVDSTPVVSRIPQNIISPHLIYAANSNIKFAANGEKLAIPVADENKIVVMDFSNASGKFSNPIALTIPPGFHLEDLELSPNGTKLYYGAYEIRPGEVPAYLHSLYQMDLDAGAEGDIMATNTKLNPVADREGCTKAFCFSIFRTMQLAPDGKIYISKRIADTIVNLDALLGTIENPNEPGKLCYYKGAGLDLKNKYGIIAYNYMRTQSFTPAENGIQVQKNNCADKPVSFSLLYKNVDSVKWDFGDPASGNSNYSREPRPGHTYPAPGTYTATAIIYKSCFADTAVKEFVISEDPAIHVPDAIKDTTVCTDQTLHLDATTPTATSYAWGLSTITPSYDITRAGTYAVTVYNSCSVDSREFLVTYEDCDCKVFVPTAFTPNGDGLNDVFRPAIYCHAKDLKFEVYNKYGARVYMTIAKDNGWNGFVGSTLSPGGVYVWKLQYRNPNNGKLFRQNGTVVLMR